MSKIPKNMAASVRARLLNIAREEKFAENKDRNQMWQSYLKKIGKEPFDFNESMKRLNEFLLPIYNSILDNTEFSGGWNSKKGIWENYKY